MEPQNGTERRNDADPEAAMRREVFDKLRELMEASDAYFAAINRPQPSAIDVSNAVCAGLAAMCEFSRAKARISP